MTVRTADGRREPRAYPRRFAIALGVAVVLHAIGVALIPPGTKPPPPEHVVTETIALVRRTPPPTPRPTRPPPTPRPRINVTSPPHPTLAPRAVVRNPAPKAAATPLRRLGGAAAHMKVAIVPPHIIAKSEHRSLAEGVHAGQQNGGSGTGAGAGAGSGGLGGTGSGTGGNGNGTAGATNAGPCGDVFLLPATVSYRPDGTVVQDVLAKVILGDGRVEVGAFPYPFVYSAEKLNPFTHEAATLPGHTIPVQLPPPGSDIAAAPKAVQIALQYTNPATGTTTLPQCGAPPQPAG
ncbi:MAG: hypothetical protein M3R44_01045 [Candidatus Eremiobacteraeota bacterium]|nr:hypothetical protein [Candidatus Eremiobacteraeota bacterium]